VRGRLAAEVKAENHMRGHIIHLDAAAWKRGHGLQNETQLRLLAELRDDFRAQPRRARINAQTSDPPCLDVLSLGRQLDAMRANLCRRPVRIGDELLECGRRPDGRPLRGVLGIGSGKIGDGDCIFEILG